MKLLLVKGPKRNLKIVTPVLKVSRILNTFVKTDTGYIKSYNTESDISRNSDTRVIYYII